MSKQHGLTAEELMSEQHGISTEVLTIQRLKQQHCTCKNDNENNYCPSCYGRMKEGLALRYYEARLMCVKLEQQMMCLENHIYQYRSDE